MSDEESKQSACTSLGEVANGTHMEYCSNCGKKIEKPIYPKGTFSAQTNAENRSRPTDEAQATIS